MRVIIILALLFCIMLLVPVVGATIYYKKREGDILYINQNKTKNARYFAMSFADIMEKNIPEIKDNKIFLSKEEEIVDSTSIQDNERTITKIVICKEEQFYTPQSVESYEKEIYSEGDIILDKENLQLRAAYAKKRMLIGDYIQVVRWVDAEQTLAVYDNCDLGISATAAERMSIGRNCKFRRLYAPEILLGQLPNHDTNLLHDREVSILNMEVQRGNIRRIQYVNKEKINQDGIADFSIISNDHITVLERIIVRGDIRSHKSIRLCDGVVVCGNLFAEEDIYIDKNVSVFGSVFSQGNIYMESGSMIGRPNHGCSVIARKNIEIGSQCVVFGYISCEGEGRTGSESPKEFEEKEKGSYQFLDLPAYETEITFRDLDEYSLLGKQGFRKNHKLTQIAIPKGANEIFGSMFFECTGMEKVILSDSLKQIGDYAFFGCNELKELEGFEDTSIECIGTSAFEHCESLQTVHIPNTLTELGKAAFCRCKQLERVKILEDSKLKNIGSHCFLGCSELKEIYIPDSVEYIGMSAFRECVQLKIIELPEHCKSQSGILELLENHSEIEFIWRKDQEWQETK